MLHFTNLLCPGTMSLPYSNLYTCLCFVADMKYEILHLDSSNKSFTNGHFYFFASVSCNMIQFEKCVLWLIICCKIISTWTAVCARNFVGGLVIYVQCLLSLKHEKIAYTHSWMNA